MPSVKSSAIVALLLICGISSPVAIGRSHQQSRSAGQPVKNQIALENVPQREGKFYFQVQDFRQEANGNWKPGGSADGMSILNHESWVNGGKSEILSLDAVDVQCPILDHSIRLILRQLETGEYLLEAHCEAWAPATSEDGELLAKGSSLQIHRRVMLDIPTIITLEDFGGSGETFRFEVVYSTEPINRE